MKILKAAMALIMAAALTQSGVIDENDSESSGSVSVGYSVSASYEVTIPANVEFTDADKNTAIERPLQANNVLLEEGKHLNIYVKSQNGFRMVNNEGYIEYTLHANGSLISGTDNVKILTVSPGDKSGWVLLSFTSALSGDYSGFAGNYSDTLTFTVEMV